MRRLGSFALALVVAGAGVMTAEVAQAASKRGTVTAYTNGTAAARADVELFNAISTTQSGYFRTVSDMNFGDGHAVYGHVSGSHKYRNKCVVGGGSFIYCLLWRADGADNTSTVQKGTLTGGGGTVYFSGGSPVFEYKTYGSACVDIRLQVDPCSSSLVLHTVL